MWYKSEKFSQGNENKTITNQTQQHYIDLHCFDLDINMVARKRRTTIDVIVSTIQYP
jgi:hypothetical protein